MRENLFESFYKLFNGMDKSCSFRGIGQLQCGESRGKNVTLMLTECNADVTSHLSVCHLSRTNLKEFELILLRAGHFNLADEQIAVMRICPSHRNNLGRLWKAPRTCQHPLHSGAVRKCQGRDVFNPQISEEVSKLHGKLVQVGSRK